ncbi:hypothetical protein ABXT21_19680 [Ralstonia sp. SM1864_UCD524_TZ4]|uniref:Uncharacterized protein n=1 Tax=Ralstonia solanacearum TaxID=305 RepID=A0A0S4UL72_RALSL|nr:hypothetical protein [Ralstonia pseudosolanacearum]CUV22919.1 protein of unknown function [Ralstonia solanacearum]CUV40630.1 protein of unknown function [Ralstonia solanacearum]CUV60707.1 protein of unknown function [Ralstonia solanacearum]
MISIGAVYLGPEHQGSEVHATITSAIEILKALHAPGDVESPLVNAVFVVTGSQGAADFDYPQYGEQSSTKVVVQLPVNGTGLSGQELIDEVVDGLRGANAMAFEYFRQRGEVFRLRDAEALVTQLATQLRAVSTK